MPDLNDVNAQLDAHHKIAALKKNMKGKSESEQRAMGNRIEQIEHAAKKHGGVISHEEGKRRVQKACDGDPKIKREVDDCFPGRHGYRRGRPPRRLPGVLEVD